MVFESQTKLISLIPQGQRGTSIFLTLNPGETISARVQLGEKRAPVVQPLERTEIGI
jgi:hypothetical protein